VFNLARYLQRINLSDVSVADSETLSRLQFAHRLSIPFENIDVKLGKPVEIDSGAVYEKLVGRARGGYCFEQNQLFLDALTSLGFTARTLLARVWLGSDSTPPKTHSLILVTIEDEQWIADAGFGGSFVPPMRLVAGTRVQAPDGARYLLQQTEPSNWLLSRIPAPSDGAAGSEGDSQAQYSFDLSEVFHADLALANHWTSTAPDSLFRNQQFVNAVLPQGFVSLVDRKLQETVGPERRTTVIDTRQAYLTVLADRFGISVSADEVEALGLF
jgi:N-hydroxyarylamine O-acetyltransferase